MKPINSQHISTFTEKLHPLLWSFFSAIVLHVFCYAIWGMFYSEQTDKFFTAYVDGSFDGGHTKALFYNYGFFTGISQVMAWAYSFMPQFNWYGIVGQGFMVLATSGFLFLFLAFYRSVTKYKWLVVLMALGLSPFWVYHIVLYRTTELAGLLFGISSFILLFSLVPSIATGMGRVWPVRIFFLLVIMSSGFVRIEPVLMGSIIWFPYMLLALPYNASRRSLMTILVCTGIGVGVAYGLYMSDLGPGSATFKEIRVYTHTIWDFGQDDEHLTLSTAADSIKLKAAQRFFISDKDGMDGAFYESIGIFPLEKSLSSLPEYLPDLHLRFSKALYVWQVLIDAERVTIFSVLILFVGFSLLMLISGNWRQWLVVLLMQFWFWTILFLTTVFMKMELRILFPLITLDLVILSVLLLYWLFVDKVVKPYALTMSLTMVVLLAVVGVFKHSEMQGIVTGYKQAAANIKAFKKEVLEKHSDKTIFFNSICWHLLYADLFDNNELQQQVELLAFDNGELYMYPSHQNTMKKWCGSANLGDIGNTMLERQNDVLIVSSTDRMVLVTDYMRIVYGVNWDVVPAYPNSVLSNPPFTDKMMPIYMDHHDISYFVLRTPAN